MIKPRKITALVFGIEIFVVPICCHDQPVRVQARKHQENYVIKNALRFRIRSGYQIVSEFRCHLRAPDLRSVKAH